MTESLTQERRRAGWRSPLAGVSARIDARRRRYTDAMAQRAYDRLAADPTSYRRSPSLTGALALALGVLAGGVVVVGLVAWLAVVCLTDPAWWSWPLLVVAVLMLLAARPRRLGLSGSGWIAEPDDLPALRALVDEIAAAVGVRPPRTLATTCELNAHVQPYGWSGRPLLAIGLPLWRSLSPAERVFLLGHELGHLRNRDSTTGRVLFAADRLLGNVITVLKPTRVRLKSTHARTNFNLPLVAEITMVVMATVRLPFQLVRWRLRRSAAFARQHNEYLADRRAATLAGARAGETLMSRDTRGVWIRAAAAVRRGGDAFAVFETPVPDDAAVARHLSESELDAIRSDSSHPPDHLRIRLLQQCGAEPAGQVDSARLAAAEAELMGLMTRRTKAMRDLLVTTWAR